MVWHGSATYRTLAAHYSNTVVMDETTCSALEERVRTLELEVGGAESISKDPQSLLSELSILQHKVQLLYEKQPELNLLTEATKEFGISRDTTGNSAEVSEAEKQEQLLIKYPSIMEAYVNLTELLSLSIPNIDEAAYEKLNIGKVLQHQQDLEEIAKNFHIQVVKHLLVLEKFTAMVEAESMFWANAERRLNTLGATLTALERQKRLESKY